MPGTFVIFISYKNSRINGAYYIPTISLRQGQTAKNWYKPCNFAPKMDESGDFWRPVTTEMAVRHNKCEPAPPAAFQSVLAVAAAVMQRGPPKKKSLTGKSGKAQPVPPTGIEPVRCFHRGILSPLRLPVPPRRLTVWYCSAKRGNCQSAKPCRLECKKANGLFAANGKAARFMRQCTRYFICGVFLYPPTSHLFISCGAPPPTRGIVQ